MPRVLNLHAILDNEKLKTCTIWVEEGGQAISESVSGHTVEHIENFFKKRRDLMLSAEPRDFSTWLVSSHAQSVLIADEPPLYEELGLKFR